MGARISAIKDLLLYQTIRFFRLRGSRETGARGFAVGLTCNFFPTFGFGALLSGFLARLCGGNIVAGFLGGSVLAFFWPVLFFLNVRVGAVFLRPAVRVEEMDDVTPQAIDALVWGKTFLIGAVLNSLVFGGLAYVGFLLLYARVQPSALRWLRGRLRKRRLKEAMRA